MYPGSPEGLDLGLSNEADRSVGIVDLRLVAEGNMRAFRLFGPSDIHIATVALPSEWDDEMVEAYLSGYKQALRPNADVDLDDPDMLGIAHVRMDQMEAMDLVRTIESEG